MHTLPSSDDDYDSTDGQPLLLLGDEKPASATHRALSAPLAALAETEQWSDWRWQMRNRIRSLSQLKSFFTEVEPMTGLYDALRRFQMAITPYYAALIRSLGNDDPIFRMSIPQAQELINPPFLQADPLEEDHHSPVPGLVHRYPDRALIVATSACAMYCRHCTRKRVTGARESCLSSARLGAITEYLMQHPEIKDVVVSGGDPLTLPTDTLETILAAVRSVPSVEIIRIGTRTLVTLPMRITDELTTMLRKYHPIWVNTHFNHPVEITPEAEAACTRLADAGVPLGNQTVLLRGVNDDPQVIEELCRKLVKIRVRPYYLFQCDLVAGVEHFRTPITRGIEIMEYLRGRVSGLAIPTYVVDAPGGGGKIPVLPTYVVSTSPTHTVLRNFEGVMIRYPEPSVETIPGEAVAAQAGAVRTWDMTNGRADRLGPQGAAKQKRRVSRKVLCPDESLIPAMF